MSILKIATAGAEVLRKGADPVSPAEIMSEDLQRFISDLKESLLDSGGVGLAAPQVYCSKRIVAVSIREGVLEENAAISSVPMEIWINPVFRKLSDRREAGWEGCLSIPGYMGLVERPVTVELEGFDEKGEKRSRQASGYYARVLQHEIDHLDGVLYIDRMKDMRSFCRDDGSQIL
jgi:peptide deformylase